MEWMRVQAQNLIRMGRLSQSAAGGSSLPELWQEWEREEREKNSAC